MDRGDEGENEPMASDAVKLDPRLTKNWKRKNGEMFLGAGRWVALLKNRFVDRSGSETIEIVRFYIFYFIFFKFNFIHFVGILVKLNDLQRCRIFLKNDLMNLNWIGLNLGRFKGKMNEFSFCGVAWFFKKIIVILFEFNWIKLN